MYFFLTGLLILDGERFGGMNGQDATIRAEGNHVVLQRNIDVHACIVRDAPERDAGAAVGQSPANRQRLTIGTER